MMRIPEINKVPCFNELEEIKARTYLFGMLVLEVSGLLRLKFDKPGLSRELQQSGTAIGMYVRKAICSVHIDEFIA